MRKSLVTLLVVLAFSGQSANCEGVRMTASQLTALIKSSDSRVTASNLTVIGTGPSVTVLAEKSPTASDRDLKIDAIFLAKALIEGSAGQVEKVKALFSQPDKPGRFVMVDKKVVDDYAGGKLTPEQLLGCITLTPLEAEKVPDVAPGAFEERRLLVWRRIEKLRQNGTGVATFQKLFQQVEQLAKNTESSPETLLRDIAFLEQKLSEQEALVMQAKRTREGHGIKQPNPTATNTTTTGTSGPSSLAQRQHEQQQQQQPPAAPATSSRPPNTQWGGGGTGGGGGGSNWDRWGPPPAGGWPPGQGPGPDGRGFPQGGGGPPP